MRKALVLIATAALALGVAAAGSASAATSCTVTGTVCSMSTPVDVVVSGGGLTLDVSTAGTLVHLASGASLLPGAPATGDLGTTSVTDTRGSSTGWSVTASGTAFTSGSNTIPISAATLQPVGLAGATALPSLCGTGGAVTFTTTTAALALSTSPQTVATCAAISTVVTSVIGSSNASWKNTLALTIPSNAAAGTYASTVTQSVQ